MPDLWQTESIYKKIWNLPDLLSKLCFPGQASGRNKIKLVINIVLSFKCLIKQINDLSQNLKLDELDLKF